jgi:adenosine deaminase
MSNIQNMLKFLLSDDESLSHYANGSWVSFDDIKRRMLLKARDQNPFIPDHLYRLSQHDTFSSIKSIGDIFIKGMEPLANEFLEIDQNRIYIKRNQQNNWQELITHVPPLLLQCLVIHSQVYDVHKENIKEIKLFFETYVLPNTRHTAIVRPRIPQLDFYIEQQQGLHDLHMHLNGALETDQVWQDYLFYPMGIYEDLKKGFRIAKVKEQFEQESRLLEPLAFVTLLKAAQKLRQFFFDHLFSNINPLMRWETISSKHMFLNRIMNNHSDMQGGYRHPFIYLITSEDSYPHLMAIEGLMYILILGEIKRTDSNFLSGTFHFYLLILGLANRLLVQQTHQKGFEQFQKHTYNEMRESSEKTYLRRYHQMQGNDLSYLHFLEGRFSPKESETQMIRFIDTIFKGWDKMRSDRNKSPDSNRPSNNKPAPELKLTAHFIKRPDKELHDLIRHRDLRYDLIRRGKVLAFLLKRYAKYRERVVAIDAAASEFDTPPEVFAPVFRHMRRSGVKHFTFHAGEDFYHIVGGLRAVYEAIIFCDLRTGDRIGHATATGLSPTLWGQVVGNKIHIHQGDYLDNLTFCYHFIVKRNISALHHLLPNITNAITNLGFKIYKTFYPVAELENAWLIREYCPLHALSNNRQNIEATPIFNEEEWHYTRKKKIDCAADDSDIWRIFQVYHDKNYRHLFEKIIRIDPFDIINASEIKILQQEILAEMSMREIVIETMPTSNVRIGFHKNFSTHQIKNWLDWKDQGKAIPPIVLGSDDTGIFATNIYNEYANIYCTLLNDHGMHHSKIMDVIKNFDENSRIYRFT